MKEYGDINDYFAVFNTLLSPTIAEHPYYVRTYKNLKSSGTRNIALTI
ncbi:hypothetical protein HYY71_01765 [Candidatus Woesearchaeota archaeon]|nr:hypothetical protein [Candidatus Woesearchaeota archaeon]